MEKSVKALLPSPDLEDIQREWPLTDYEYQSLRDDIKAHGIRNPLLIYESDGQLFILAGFHRWKIAGELGLDTVPVEYYAGTDTTDARRQYAILENMARRQVTTETKKKLAKIYLEGNPRASDRAIGKLTGLDNKTIAQVRADMVGREEIPHVDKRTDTRGRKQPAKKPPRQPKPEPDKQKPAPPRVTEKPYQAEPPKKVEVKQAIWDYIRTSKDRKKAARELIDYIEIFVNKQK